MKSMISGKTQNARATMLVLLASSAGVALLLSGCGANMKVASVPVPAAAKATGTVSGGQQPLPGVSLQFYTTGSGSYGAAASTYGPAFATDPGIGSFSFPVLPACPAGNPEVFLVGSGGTPVGFSPNPYIKLMVALGPCNTLTNSIATTQYHISLNELTTVAMAWSLSGFMTGPTNIGAPASNATGLQNAFANINEIVNITTGAANPASAGVNPPTQTINALGNILQNCINSAGGSSSDPTDGHTTGTPCDKLMFLTTLAPAAAPADTVTAALNIAQHPGSNAGVSNYVEYLYDLQASSPAFPSTLSPAPTDWTLAINYTPTGMASPQSIAADGLGNVWVTNKPSTGTGSVTELTVNSGAIAAPVYTASNYIANVNLPYGVAIDTSNNAWITNTGDNSLTMIAPGGTASTNYTLNGLSTPEGIAIDGAGNVWVVNNGNSTLSGFTNAGAALTNSPYSGGGLSAPSSIAVNPK